MQRLQPKENRGTCSVSYCTPEHGKLTMVVVVTQGRPTGTPMIYKGDIDLGLPRRRGEVLTKNMRAYTSRLFSFGVAIPMLLHSLASVLLRLSVQVRRSHLKNPPIQTMNMNMSTRTRSVVPMPPRTIWK